jgi:hypothetical protein
LGHHSSPESVNGEGVDKSGNGLESLGIKSVACIVRMSGKGGPINKDGESVGGGGAGIADTETLDVVIVTSGGAVVVVVLDDGKLTVEEGGEVVVVEGHGSLALVVGAEDVDGEVTAVGAVDVEADVVGATVVVETGKRGVVVVVLDSEVVKVETGVDDVVVECHVVLVSVVVVGVVGQDPAHVTGKR